MLVSSPSHVCPLDSGAALARPRLAPAAPLPSGSSGPCEDVDMDGKYTPHGLHRDRWRSTNDPRDSIRLRGGSEGQASSLGPVRSNCSPPFGPTPPSLEQFIAAETTTTSIPVPSEPYDPDVWVGHADHPFAHLPRDIPYPESARMTCISRFSVDPPAVKHFDPRWTLADLRQFGSLLTWITVPLPQHPDRASLDVDPAASKRSGAPRPNHRPSKSDEANYQLSQIEDANVDKGKGRAPPEDSASRFARLPLMLEYDGGCEQCVSSGRVCIRILITVCLYCWQHKKTCHFSRRSKTDRQLTRVPRCYTELVTPCFGRNDGRLPVVVHTTIASEWLVLLNLADGGAAPCDVQGDRNWILEEREVTLPWVTFPVQGRFLFENMLQEWHAVLYSGKIPRTAKRAAAALEAPRSPLDCIGSSSVACAGAPYRPDNAAPPAVVADRCDACRVPSRSPQAHDGLAPLCPAHQHSPDQQGPHPSRFVPRMTPGSKKKRRSVAHAFAKPVDIFGPMHAHARSPAASCMCAPVHPPSSVDPRPSSSPSPRPECIETGGTIWTSAACTPPPPPLVTLTPPSRGATTADRSPVTPAHPLASALPTTASSFATLSAPSAGAPPAARPLTVFLNRTSTDAFARLCRVQRAMHVLYQRVGLAVVRADYNTLLLVSQAVQTELGALWGEMGLDLAALSILFDYEPRFRTPVPLDAYTHRYEAEFRV